jgi:formyltetrahydrofolate deformylase
MSANNSRSIILLVSCPDRKGIVAAVTGFIAKHNGNVLQLDQHVDAEESVFFMRVEWEEHGFDIPRDGIAAQFRAIADDFKMRWDLRYSDAVPRMAVYVSKDSHCLYDILSRVHSGEWNVAVPAVVGNHPDLASVAKKFGIEFREFPMSTSSKAAQEREELALMKELSVDFIVLARYMQILPADFVLQYPNRIINIHHSFLPAFPGAKPYHSAHVRGVKIIGATSHYVTAELDTGPIIEQDVIHVSHKDSVEDMVRKGKDLEKVVLARAVWWHLQNRILVYNNKTVIFE